MSKLLAYHNDQAIKEKYLSRVHAHRAADEIIKGKYWENGKGCAVGCTIHGSNHVNYETELGIPIVLARLEDVIFEGLPNGRAKNWPVDFLGAIRPGADLSRIWPQFAQWLMIDPEHGVIRFADDETKPIVEQIADLYARGGSREEFSAAESAARSAARSAAESAARSAAWSAAWSAAESAAYSARSAAYSARSAAESAAESAEFIAQADKLLALLKAA